MTWTQVYDPVGNWWLSTLIAALPIVVLFTLLAGFRVRPHRAAAGAVMAAVLVATLFFHMPLRLSVASFVYGASWGALKIAWIVIGAIFLYDVSVATGQFAIMKQSVAGITSDRRLQMLLVAFCFGAFIEGAAGFGAPVAIAGAFMIGLGFPPLEAAALNLIANTAPVAWGAIGAPVHALAAVTAMPEADLSAMIGRILPITCLIVPFWLVRTMVGWAETFEVLPAILVVGCSFGLTQFFWSNHVDSNLVDIVGGAVSLAASALFLRFWRPERIWRFPHEPKQTGIEATVAARSTHTRGERARAWLPFAVLSIFVLVWGVPPVKAAMSRYTTPAYARGGWEFPVLHNAVQRASPVVARPTPEAARWDFNWLAATGTSCFLAGVVSGLLLGLSPRRLMRIFATSFWRMRFAALAICLMLGLGFITRYAGTDAVLGIAFTRTGTLYPFFAAFLGWLGVALTGSDTSGNVLFGGLQRVTAQQLGLDPVLLCAANSAGGVMGKMIDAQSICVATAATGQLGQEGRIFRVVFWHSIALAAVVGVIVTIYAYVIPRAVPHGLSFIR